MLKSRNVFVHRSWPKFQHRCKFSSPPQVTTLVTSVFLVVKVIVSNVSTCSLIVMCVSACCCLTSAFITVFIGPDKGQLRVSLITGDQRLVLIWSTSSFHSSVITVWSESKLTNCATTCCSYPAASGWQHLCLCTAPLPECLWVCVAHHFLCGGLVGDLVPWLQGATPGGRRWARWEKRIWRAPTRLNTNPFFSHMTVLPSGCSLPGSSECSLRTSSHDLPPCCFGRTVLLSTWVHRRWCLLHLFMFSLCVCVCVFQL